MSHGQPKTNRFSQLFSRIEGVRVALDLGWDQLAQRMGVNRSLFFQVKRAAEGKKGGCGLSVRNLAKLEALEREAGILKEKQVLDALSDVAKADVPAEYQAAAVREEFEQRGIVSASDRLPDVMLIELHEIGTQIRTLASSFERLEARIRKWASQQSEKGETYGHSKKSSGEVE